MFLAIKLNWYLQWDIFSLIFSAIALHTIKWFKINARYACSLPSYSLDIAITKPGCTFQQFAVMVLQNDHKDFRLSFVAATIWNDKFGFSVLLNRLNNFLQVLSTNLVAKKQSFCSFYGLIFQNTCLTNTISPFLTFKLNFSL